MKKLFHKLKTGLITAIALLFTAGMCHASIDRESLAPHWHVDITTTKHSVEFYGRPSSGKIRAWVVSPGYFDFVGGIKHYTKDFLLSGIEKFATNAGAISFADAPDLSAISTGFFVKGPEVLRKRVNTWDLAKSGIRVYKKVKAPIKLAKLSAKGGPRPYRDNDDSSGNGFAYSDRELKVNQSKWDYTYSPEEFRNTYLDDDSEKPEYEQGLDQMSKEYVAHINNTTMGSGVYNASGTGPADMATGFLTIIANEITATKITPVVTGAITSSNALAKVELVATAMPSWMRESESTKILCSYDIFDKYKNNYRSVNGFAFQPREAGAYYVDGFANCQLTPVSWMGTSQRLICTVDNNLCVGTDSDGIGVHPSPKFNLIETRLTMPIGFQISDLDALIVNDQA